MEGVDNEFIFVWSESVEITPPYHHLKSIIGFRRKSEAVKLTILGEIDQMILIYFTFNGGIMRPREIDVNNGSLPGFFLWLMKHERKLLTCLKGLHLSTSNRGVIDLNPSVANILFLIIPIIEINIVAIIFDIESAAFVLEVCPHADPLYILKIRGRKGINAILLSKTMLLIQKHVILL